MAANEFPNAFSRGHWGAYFTQAGHVLFHRASENPAVIDDVIYPDSDTDNDNGSECISNKADSATSGSRLDNGNNVDSQSHNSCTTQRKPVEEYAAADVIRRFMEPGGGLTNQPQCKTISEFCHKATVYELQNESLGTLGDGRTLLDDKCPSSMETRPYLGPLNAHQLYEELKRRRFSERESPSRHAAAVDISNRMSDGNLAPNGINSQLGRLPGTVNGRKLQPQWTPLAECDAERRLLFTENPDERDILALLATASRSHAPVLRDFVNSYLASETSIGLRANPHGVKRFNLFFHIAYYAFREDAEPGYDKRTWENGKPLRRTTKLPALDIAGNDERDTSIILGCLYETQVCVEMLVLDDRPELRQTISTTYGFVDTFHGSPESVKIYDGWTRPEFRPDPLTYGERDAGLPILCPQMYFLVVLELRIGGVLREWEAVVSGLTRIVQEKGPSILLQASSISYSRISQEEKRKQQYRYMSCINEMMEALSDLTNLLSTTIIAWEEFEKRHSDLFPEQIFTSMTNIGDTFSGMRRLRLKMSKLREKLLENRSALIAYLSVENNDVAKFIKVLTAMTILFMPISLNTALFSTQSGVMPFEMDFTSFVISFATVSILVFTAWLGLSYWDVARIVLQHGILLAFEDLGTRSQILFNKIKSKMTGIAKVWEGITSRPSHLQSVVPGTSLGRAIGVTTNKRSLRHLTKQKLNSLLSWRSKGPYSESGDIEMGSLEPRSGAM